MTPPPQTTQTPRTPDGSGAMFDAIASRYDLLNRLISLGIDQSWRRKTVEALNLPPNARVLDIATGTGDLALLIAAMHPDARITGLDPSERMLEVARQKITDSPANSRVELLLGNAECLPFEEQSVDGSCIAFGIRNVPDRRKALSEMARITRVGGRIAILELSEPTGGIMAPIARFHIHTVVPWLGSLLSGAREYRYLQQSIAAFPSAHTFAQMMEQAGLKVLDAIPLTFGVCHLYIAEPKPRA